MKYTVKNVTLDIDTTDGEFTGDCIFYVPFKHKSFIKDACGVEKNKRYYIDSYEPIFEHAYGGFNINKEMKCFTCDSPDLLIAYLSWLLSQDDNFTVEVEYANPFWAIHDMEHAKFDESGCSIYVDEYIELQRLKDAFDLFIKEGYKITYELIQEVEEAYNDRFGTTVSFEEYLYQEDYEDEEEYSNS